MPVQRLEPTSTEAPEFSGISVQGVGTAHEALSDASDFSYVQLQVSDAEPSKWFRGGLSDLPDGAGTVTGTVINVRAAVTTGDGKLRSGDYPNVRLTDTLDATPTDYATGSLSLGTAAQLNAASWMAGCDWVSVDGSIIRIYKMNFDASFEYITRVSVAMIFQWLGPLVAVLPHEMAALRLELWRRGRVWLRRSELPLAWRDLREDPRRHHVVLG